MRWPRWLFDNRTGEERCRDGEHEWPLWFGAGSLYQQIPCSRGCGATKLGADLTSRDQR